MTDAPATKKKMNERGHCAQCGASLPSDIAGGICPQCELRGALNLATDITQIASGPAAHAGEATASALPASLQDSSTPPLHSPSPVRFGDYKLLEEIAQGGMGIVYKARQMSLNRMVAVKMILAGQFASKQIAQRFRGEAGAAAVLQHPNIVAVHEVGVHEGQHFFSMDYVEGQNLAQLVGNRPLPPQKAARYVKVSAEAIHYAHQQGILHRDLKPSNVLIDAATDQPRVTDFGLAKRLDGESSITVTGQVLGSPNFMPPEQASGSSGKVGRHSDVYGLGGILFYLLTARAPFQGETLERTIHQVLNAEAISPRLLSPSVPRDLETICLKCLEKEPSRRYQTAQELAVELDRFLRDEPIHARPVSRAERAWRWCRRKPALAGSLATATVLLLIVAIGSPIAAFRINRARLDKQHEAQRAEAGETAFRLSAYAADMNLAHVALQEHNLARAVQLLQGWIPTNTGSRSQLLAPHANGVQTENGKPQTIPDSRGWEWRYLHSQCRNDERATLTRPDAKHSDFIISVAYSPDGKWLASGSHDGRVKLFDPSTRREVGELPHAKPVRAVAFSPRDSTLATLCADGFVRFWDVQTRSNIGAISASATEYSGAVAFSREGSLLAFSDARPGWVTVSNLTTQTFFAIEAHTGSLSGLSFSSDATVLATRGRDDGQIKLWDVHSGRLKHELPHTSWGVSTVAFSPDGQRLVSTSLDQTVKLWDTESGQLLHTQKSRVGNPNAALFLPDGKTVAVANADYTITLWDVTGEPWQEQAVLKGHRESVWSLALSPDGTELASGSTDGEVKLWSTTPPPERSDWLPSPTNLSAHYFSTDARAILLALKDRTIELWDSATLAKTATFVWRETDTAAFALYSDGKTIASGGKDGTVKVWRVAGRSLQEERSFRAGTNGAGHLAFSPDGKTIAIGQRTAILLCDVRSGQVLHQLDHQSVSKLKFSPDGRHLVSTGWAAKGLKLWDVASGRCEWTGKHERSTVDAAFFPDGQRLVTGAWEPKAKLWDSMSGRELATFQGQLQGADSVAVSPDGRRVAMGTGEGTVKLFMFGASQPLEVMTLACQQPGVGAVSFLPDGDTLVAAYRGGFQVWHAPTFEQIGEQEAKRGRYP